MSVSSFYFLVLIIPQYSKNCCLNRLHYNVGETLGLNERNCEITEVMIIEGETHAEVL
jgi:hypothetical protein